MSREMWIVVWVVVAVVAIITLVFAVKLVLRLLATRKMLGELGTSGKVAFYGALVYTIFPVDLLPDPIYLDDIGVLATALTVLTTLIRKRRQKKAGLLVPEARRPEVTGSEPRGRRR